MLRRGLIEKLFPDTAKAFRRNAQVRSNIDQWDAGSDIRMFFDQLPVPIFGMIALGSI